MRQESVDALLDTRLPPAQGAGVSVSTTPAGDSFALEEALAQTTPTADLVLSPMPSEPDLASMRRGSISAMYAAGHAVEALEMHVAEAHAMETQSVEVHAPEMPEAEAVPTLSPSLLEATTQHVTSQGPGGH